MIYVGGKSKWSVDDQFRLIAFRVAWGNVYAHVEDTTERFLSALEYSAQPVKNRAIVRAWWEWTHGQKIGPMLEKGMEPPAILRPMINAYLAAVKRAEWGMLDCEDYE